MAGVVEAVMVRAGAAARVVEVEFVCGKCGKRCKSKGGLVVHRRRVHEVSEKKKMFECHGCKSSFSQEANLWNHKKICGGGEASGSDRRMCVCGREFAKSYIARHKKKCLIALAVNREEDRRVPRVYESERMECDCGRQMAKTNYARHKREACLNR